MADLKVSLQQTYGEKQEMLTHHEFLNQIWK